MCLTICFVLGAFTAESELNYWPMSELAFESSFCQKRQKLRLVFGKLAKSPTDTNYTE